MASRRSVTTGAFAHRFASAGLAVALAACSTGLDALPPTAQVTCSSTTDCPGGWFCQTTIGKCVRSDATGTPPAIAAGSAALDHGSAKGGTAVVVSFTVTTDLAVAPLVELGTPGTRAAFQQKAQAGRDWAFSLVLGQDVPDGTYPVLATLVGANGAIATDQPLGNLLVDSTPPAISRVDVLEAVVSAGQTAVLEVTFGEPLTAPTARFQGAPDAPLTARSTAQAQVWRFEYAATGAEPEGPATVVVEAADAAGNVLTRTAADAVVFDFTKPGLAAAPEIATPVVRPGQQAVVRLTASEPLDGDPAVDLVGRTSGAVLPLAVAERVGAGFTFGRLVLPADGSEVYDVRVRGLVDLAGNVGADVTSGTIRIDATPPSVTAGPTLGKANGQYRAGETVAVTFTASEDLAGPPSVRLTTTPPLALGCAEGAARAWTCQLAAPLTGAEVPATAVNVVVELVDRAGNVGSTSATATLDFTPPGLVVGSVGLSLVPPPGALVPAVTALATGGKVRATFTADEPLSVEPVVATATPEVIALALVGQAATTYTYEATLSGAHAQGAYALRATLTDRAGNVSQQTLTGPGRALTVDSVAPASPGVGSASLVVFDRVPWGSAATSGLPRFTVSGGAGAAEAGATVIALDGPNAGAAVELARGTAAANGSFALTLGGADRTQVWVAAVDGAGNPSDGDGAAAGPQGVRVRDVTWTATLLGKVPESTLENPHVLEARPRWLGSVRQGGSVEKALPADTTGALAWNVVAGTAWPAAPAALAQDPARGKLVAFRSDGTREVAEFDGFRWTMTPFTGGPKAVMSAVFDPRRGEVVVYADPCDGGTVLWSWNGARWRPIAQGASWSQWGAGGVAGPGPHKPASLALDESSGHLYLSMAYYSGDPYTCGDQAGTMDYGTYRFDGASWSLLAGASGSGGPFGYDPVRRVVVRRSSTGAVQEWNGTAWSTITISDPEADGNPATTSTTARFAWDPIASRLVTSVSGVLWQYSGSSFRNLGAAPAWVLATDHLGGRVVGLTATGLHAWGGAAFTQLAAPAAAVSPVGLVWNSTARAMEAFDSSGAVYRWSGGAWTLQPPSGGVAAPTSLWAACAYPSGGVFACGSACYVWNGTSWASHGAPASYTNLVAYPGLGVLGLNGNALIWRLAGTAWTAIETAGDTPYWVGDPVYSPALGGLVHGAKTNPYGTDNNLYRWTGSGSWTPPYFQTAGYGAVRPIAADGMNRTFALHDFQTTYLVGGASPVQAASIDDPYGVDFPSTAAASAWSPDDSAIYVASGASLSRLETEVSSRPGHLVRFAWPSSGGPDLHACLGAGTACQVSRVDLAWGGIATGNRTTQTSSATLWLLDGIRWVPLAAGSSSGIAGAVSITAAVTDRNLIGRMAFGPASEVVAAVTVASGTLSASSQLRTDAVSLKVTYRLP